MQRYCSFKLLSHFLPFNLLPSMGAFTEKDSCCEFNRPANLPRCSLLKWNE
jgi:hypothetical protein